MFCGISRNCAFRAVFWWDLKKFSISYRDWWDFNKFIISCGISVGFQEITHFVLSLIVISGD